MKERFIGRSRLRCGALGLGCNRLLDPTDPELVKVAQTALDLGMNLFDGADMYGDGRCELFLGKILRERRGEAVIVSKFGMVRAESGAGYRIDTTPAYVGRACEASLSRLGMDHIDLYYQHQMSPDVPIEDTVGAMADLVRQGKVREIGLCNTTPELIRRAHKTHPIAAVQMEYSLMDRGVEDEILPLCDELGISFVAYGPLTYAFLSGAVKTRSDLPAEDGFRMRQSRFSDENLAHNYRLLQALEDVARELNARPAQVALAWCLHRPHQVLPIPGSSKLAHLKENSAAADIALTEAQVARLDSTFAHGAVKGAGAFASHPAH